MVPGYPGVVPGYLGGVCRIFTQSFDISKGHSKILRIKTKAVFTTGSSIKVDMDGVFGHYWDLLTKQNQFQLELQQGEGLKPPECPAWSHPIPQNKLRLPKSHMD